MTSAVYARLLGPDTGQDGTGGGGDNSGEMWRDATWESELMRHQLCDTTVAVCVSAAWLLNNTSLLLLTSPDFSLVMHFYECVSQ